MGGSLHIAAVALVWMLFLLSVIGAPLLALLLPEAQVQAPEWLAGAVRVGGYGLFGSWLIGTELYLRWESARHG